MLFDNIYKSVMERNMYLTYKITYNYFGMKIINNVEKKNKVNYLLEYNVNLINDNVLKLFNSDKLIFDLLVKLCIKKGNRKLALKMIKKSFLLIREFFWINAFFLLRLILIKSESVFILQKYKLGRERKGNT